MVIDEIQSIQNRMLRIKVKKTGVAGLIITVSLKRNIRESERRKPIADFSTAINPNFSAVLRKE